MPIPKFRYTCGIMAICIKKNSDPLYKEMALRPVHLDEKEWVKFAEKVVDFMNAELVRGSSAARPSSEGRARPTHTNDGD
jgi:hypothetical protein